MHCTPPEDPAPAPPRKHPLQGLLSPRAGAAMGAFYLATTALTHLNKTAGAAVFLAGLAAFRRPLGRLLQGTLVSSWRQLNQAARGSWLQGPPAADSADDSERPFDYRPLVVLCTSAVCLTLIEYFGHRNTYSDFINRTARGFFGHPYYELSTYAYWSLARLVGYVVLPWLVVTLMPGERLRDYGLSAKGFKEHLWIYGALLLVVIPAVVMVSFTRSFQNTYPFYKLAGRSWVDYLAWEGLYALQFFALEVFFRGFMIHPLKESMGAYAIFAMVVPYCMIHFNKPLPEVLGAVVAGVVLGTLSLRTGSIYCGVLIHISVAWLMDGLSMAHTVGLPGRHRVIL